MQEFTVTPIIPYPYCCVCFEKLTPNNIVIRKNIIKWNVCLDCEEKVNWEDNNAAIL